MKKEIVSTEAAPAAIGPYSQACAAGNLLFTSGQIGLDPQSGALVPGGIKEQSARALENLLAVLEAGGSSPDMVLKTTCFLANMNDFSAFNEVYGKIFKADALPARSCFSVAGLPKGALVEIEAVALCK